MKYSTGVYCKATNEMLSLLQRLGEGGEDLNLRLSMLWAI